MEQSKLINFRISATLARALAKEADRAEVTQAHFVREAIKAHIERAKDRRTQKAA